MLVFSLFIFTVPYKIFKSFISQLFFKYYSKICFGFNNAKIGVVIVNRVIMTWQIWSLSFMYCIPPTRCIHSLKFNLANSVSLSTSPLPFAHTHKHTHSRAKVHGSSVIPMWHTQKLVCSTSRRIKKKIQCKAELQTHVVTR